MPPMSPVPVPPMPHPCPDPGTDPCTQCPPRVYRNPPDVVVVPGDHVTVHTDERTDQTKYTVSSVQWPVAVDPENDGIIYGDGTEDNPLGIYDFEGAGETVPGKPGTVPAPTAEERNMFLCGDGTWKAAVSGRECTAGEMDAWLDEVDNG